MIELHKEKNRKSVLELSKKHGFKFDENYELLAIYDNKNIVEFAYYSISHEEMYISLITDFTNDFSLTDGIMKTLIYYADLANVKFINLSVEYKRVAKAFGFKAENDSYILNVHEYYEKHKPC